MRLVFYAESALIYKDMIETEVIASGLTRTVEYYALIIWEIKMDSEETNLT